MSNTKLQCDIITISHATCIIEKLNCITIAYVLYDTYLLETTMQQKVTFSTMITYIC